ncbi:MAG: hypothetical protein LUE12_07035 [Ruminococcus sp.]|nr:hypothetical protein [Ruminococcus sp.]
MTKKYAIIKSRKVDEPNTKSGRQMRKEWETSLGGRLKVGSELEGFLMTD